MPSSAMFVTDGPPRNRIYPALPGPRKLRPDTVEVRVVGLLIMDLRTRKVSERVLSLHRLAIQAEAGPGTACRRVRTSCRRGMIGFGRSFGGGDSEP
jgi:hypothetical protein